MAKQTNPRQEVQKRTPSKITVKFNINGTPIEAEIKRGTLLADFVREELHLTGTKLACDSGDCGSCTVLIDGNAVTSCNTLAYKADGAEITTIEGIARGPELSPVQEAFIEAAAAQCGYCTPGMIMKATELLACIPNPSADEIKEAIAGNICRCTGYIKIVEAISLAAHKMNGGESAGPRVRSAHAVTMQRKEVSP